MEGSTSATQTGEEKGQAEVKHHLKRATLLVKSVLSDSLLHWESCVRDHYEMLMVLISDL